MCDERVLVPAHAFTWHENEMLQRWHFSCWWEKTFYHFKNNHTLAVKSIPYMNSKTLHKILFYV